SSERVANSACQVSSFGRACIVSSTLRMCCGRPFARLISCAPSVPIRRAAAALAADGKSHVMTVAAPSCEEDHVSRNIAIANADPQAVIWKPSLDLPIGLNHRPRDGSVVSCLHCMNDPQPEGHMASYIRRRKFLATLGGAVAWPLPARAQQAERVRRIGLLMGVADDREGQARGTVLKQALQELGWTDGRNIEIGTRFGGADAGRIRAQATELVALAPDVLVGQGTPVIRALRQATSSIPIVMVPVIDPVEQGFVSSLAHPGGNIAGFTFIDFQMVGKWLQMLKEAAPSVARAALMFNPDTSPYYYLYLRSFEAEPRSIAVEVTAAPVRDTAEVEEAIAKLGREPGAGLIVPPDAFTIVHHELFIRLAQQH